jgi:rare lipoprotein A
VHAESEIASVYRPSDPDGRGPLANGEHINTGALTAAHKSLPFGVLVRVTNKRNGLSAVVRINDRGPYIKDRIIDLTPAGAQAIGIDGHAQVDVTVICPALALSFSV